MTCQTYENEGRGQEMSWQRTGMDLKEEASLSG